MRPSPAKPTATAASASSSGLTARCSALFPRNLDVTDADLVGGKDIAPGGRSINLRGRDLRFARLDRVGLQRADLTGANLDGASLAGADLRHVRLPCDDRTDLRRSENRQAVPCASARGANFAKARLAGAQMSGLDMRGARFEGAQLEGANLANAQMTGVDFSRADLQRADLSGGATLQGANFEQANLQGADLSGASLQMADFTGAALQGATLALANLEGAVLRDAALEGAGLQGAKLFGADMRGARLHFADMSKALVWRTLPPASDSALSADMASMAVSPPSEEDMARMKSAVEGLEAGPAKVRLAGLMAPLNDAGPNGTWSGSPEALAWNSLARVSEAGMADGYRARLTEQLARLICRARFGDGAVAAGIARRAGAPGFKGDAAALYDRVKGAGLPRICNHPAPSHPRPRRRRRCGARAVTSGSDPAGLTLDASRRALLWADCRPILEHKENDILKATAAQKRGQATRSRARGRRPAANVPARNHRRPPVARSASGKRRGGPHGRFRQ